MPQILNVAANGWWLLSLFQCRAWSEVVDDGRLSSSIDANNNHGKLQQRVTWCFPPTALQDALNPGTMNAQFKSSAAGLSCFIC